MLSRQAPCAASAFYFHWAGEGEITRPVEDVQFDRLVGISSCYQYFMLREGEVLMRPYSCWCPSCFGVAVSDQVWALASPRNMKCAVAPSVITVSIPGTMQAVEQRVGRRQAVPTSVLGHMVMSSQQQPSQGNGCSLKRSTTMWMRCGLRRLFAFSAFGDAVCCKTHTDGQKNVYGTRLSTGDYLVAVQWYERLCESGNGERREFVRGRCMVDVINSTKLRMIAFEMTCIGVFPSVADDEDSDDDEVSLR